MVRPMRYPAYTRATRKGPAFKPAFPRLSNLETGYRGLFRGTFAKAREAPKGEEGNPRCARQGRHAAQAHLF